MNINVKGIINDNFWKNIGKTPKSMKGNDKTINNCKADQAMNPYSLPKFINIAAIRIAKAIEDNKVIPASIIRVFPKLNISNPKK